MAKLYILRDEKSSKKEGVKFNLFLNGYDVTSLYSTGELEGIEIKPGTHQMMLTLHGKFASLRKPQTMNFHVNSNEDVAFMIKTSGALKFQKIAMFIQCLFFFLLFGTARFTRKVSKSASDDVIRWIFLYDVICLFFFSIALVTNAVLFIYLVLMQKQQTIVEVGRRIAQ